MDRTVLTKWAVLAGLLILAFVGTLIALNSTLYSASGFVGSYLRDLARHDTAGALALPGVTAEKGVSRALLAPGALGSLSRIELVSDTDEGAGRHTVTYSYKAGSTKGTTAFSVQHSGQHLGLFSSWSFVESPIAVLTVTPLHDAQFTARSVTVQSTAASAPTRYLVFAPGDYALSHRSTYLTAPTTHAIVTSTRSPAAAQVDIQANPAFVKQVQKELDDYLAKCVTQKVLLPTGCPMGKQINDRIQDDPTWSMVTYPVVAVRPGSPAGAWQMPSTTGVSHLVVTVKSIFDGTVSTFDEDVPFTVRYLITLPADGSLLITAQYG
ncbi:MAG: hypothetical protein JWO10_986 [Microbacteriaceae bacterium]|nr:hypothetical protein [Microbacteriaceae bacterium]